MKDGKWVTINGRHVLIKDGQSPMDALIRNSTQKKNSDDEVERRERATRMYLDGEIDKSELIEDYFGGNKEGAEEYIKDLEENEYKLYKKARMDEGSIDPMTEWSTDWEALDEKYKEYYKKENLGEPSNYQSGDKIEFDNGYYNTLKGTVLREATDQEKKYQINSNLKGYLVRDENGFEYVIADTRITKPDDEFETVSKELQDIAKRTGKSDLFSEAGQRWNNLYIENKKNVSKDLGDHYTMSVGYDGRVSISSNHPYDDTDYAYAEKVGNKWEVRNPVSKERKMFNSSAEALEEMKNIDNHIRTGEKVMSNEGVSRYKKPNDTWLRNAFNEYKKQHPGTKLTLEDFKKQNK